MTNPTPAEQLAAIITGKPLAPAAPESPVPRAPRPDRSQGLGPSMPETSPAALFQAALEHHPGPGGAREHALWTDLT